MTCSDFRGFLKVLEVLLSIHGQRLIGTTRKSVIFGLRRPALHSPPGYWLVPELRLQPCCSSQRYALKLCSLMLGEVRMLAWVLQQATANRRIAAPSFHRSGADGRNRDQWLLSSRRRCEPVFRT